MVDKLKQLISQLEKAYQHASTKPSDDQEVTVEVKDGHHFEAVSFKGSKRSWENELRVIIDCVGSLKDHVNKACVQKGIPVFGDDVIKNDHNAAVIHDLWNAQKHVELDDADPKKGKRGPRSGAKPKLENISLEMRNADGTASKVLSSVTDQFKETWFVGDDGKKQLGRLKARIVNDKGVDEGDILDVIRLAVDAWNKDLGKIQPGLKIVLYTP